MYYNSSIKSNFPGRPGTESTPPGIGHEMNGKSWSGTSVFNDVSIQHPLVSHLSRYHKTSLHSSLLQQRSPCSNSMPTLFFTLTVKFDSKSAGRVFNPDLKPTDMRILIDNQCMLEMVCKDLFPNESGSSVFVYFFLPCTHLSCGMHHSINICLRLN